MPDTGFEPRQIEDIFGSVINHYAITYAANKGRYNTYIYTTKGAKGLLFVLRHGSHFIRYKI